MHPIINPQSLQPGYRIVAIQPLLQQSSGKGFEFTCKGCTEVTALVKEVEGLKQMVEDIMEKVARLRVEDKGEETGSSVTMTGVNQDREDQAREEAAGNTRTEETRTRERLGQRRRSQVSRTRERLGQRRRSQESRTRERLGQRRGRRYVLGQRLWQPTHTRGTRRAL